jgi:hypothetical protein
MASAIEETEGAINIAILVALAIGGFYLYQKFFGGGSSGGGLVGDATTDIANWWVSLTSGPAIAAAGDVTLPGGQVVAVSSLTWKTDGDNSYTEIGGSVYALSARDASGNFTLSPVTSVGATNENAGSTAGGIGPLPQTGAPGTAGTQTAATTWQ